MLDDLSSLMSWNKISASRQGPASTNLSTFSHEPLLDPAKQIRLLTCSNASAFENHLDLRIETYFLHEAPSYAALSYTWGLTETVANPGTRWLTINGNPCLVHETLKGFLENFDHSQWKEGRPAHCWLWIDALCIDQRSRSEKNAQVALMGRIFQNAVCVFAWLGLQNTERTTTTLEDLVVELSDQPNIRSKDYLYAARFENLSLSWTQAYLKNTSKFSLLYWRENMWREFQGICELAFWRRVWIRQEIWLAADVIICHG